MAIILPRETGDKIITLLEETAFLLESAAHLRGLEAQLLPSATSMRKLAKSLAEMNASDVIDSIEREARGKAPPHG